MQSIGLDACIYVTTMYPRDNYDVTSCWRVCIEYINTEATYFGLGRDTGASSTRVPVHGVPRPRIVLRCDGSTSTIDPINSA